MFRQFFKEGDPSQVTKIPMSGNFNLITSSQLANYYLVITSDNT